MKTKVYKVPAKFYLDHIGRDCGKDDKLISKNSNQVIVQLNQDGYEDLLSDADYYWYCRDEMDYGLSRSAKRTMEILKLAGAPNA